MLLFVRVIDVMVGATGADWMLLNAKLSIEYGRMLPLFEVAVMTIFVTLVVHPVKGIVALRMLPLVIVLLTCVLAES